MKGRARSPELSGGAGFTFEDAVVAYYLAALLKMEPAAAMQGAVTRVALQQSGNGEPMDDLIVDAMFDGQPSRLGLQIKTSLRISARDSEFAAVVAAAKLTRHKPDFRVGHDGYGFIVAEIANDRLRSLLRILDRARASASVADFVVRFQPGGDMSQTDHKVRDALRTVLDPADNIEEWDFYRHFVAVRFDGWQAGGTRYTDFANQLAQVADASGAQMVGHLRQLAREGQGVAAVWSRSALVSALRKLGLRLHAAPSFASDLAVLNNSAKEALQDIRFDIAGCEIERADLVEKIQLAAQSYAFTNISGLPGCGKSVVLRRAVERAAQDGAVLFLKSDRLEGASWRSYATSLGLQHRGATEILAEIGSSGTPTLFIDGIDRIAPQQRQIIADLLFAIRESPDLRSWRVLATSRDQGLEVLRSWIPVSFYAATGAGDVPVGVLSPAEAEILATAHPNLRPLLFGAEPVQEIARRPFFAAVLADQARAIGFDKAAPPQTEGELIEAWWKAGGYNADPTTADARQRALLDLAEDGAASLGRELAGRRLKESTFNHIPGLRLDGVIDNVVTGSSYKFRHDIFFEWAFFRLLIDKGSDWQSALVAAGEPPLLARIVGLLSQHRFEQEDRWADEFSALEDAGLRPQWKRAWLLGPPSSSLFLKKGSQFRTLLAANDFRLAEKFLVWFQAERTIPNASLLQRPVEGLSSAALVRAADALGWPSDIDAWRRVLAWLLGSLDAFPAFLTPHILELFKIWQNIVADYPNTFSQRILEVLERWQGDLLQADPDRWIGLSSDEREALLHGLQEVIFRAARAYPDPAARLLDRIIATKPRSTEAVDSAFRYSLVLSEIWPERLAALVRAEIFEPLPQERAAKKRRRLEAERTRRQAILAKPPSDRTDREAEFLSDIFHTFDTERYDIDDIGVDRHHRAFHPPAPAREPFLSLFRSAPETARKLVRDIANRATTGWRQVHELDKRRYGTPIPIAIDFPWGSQRFWGYGTTYAWFFGEGGPQPVETAYLALLHWAHQQLDEGADLGELIHKVVEGHEGVAALGVAISLAIERNERHPAVLALLKQQRLWTIDLMRQVQERGREINFFGFDPKEEMTSGQRAADQYLKQRTYRNHSLKDLSYLYALAEEPEHSEFVAAIGRFPTDLPLEVEEQRGDPELEAELLEKATAWSKFGSKDHYRLARLAHEPKLVQVVYDNPEPEAPEVEKRRLDAQTGLQEYGVAGWAAKSIASGVLEPWPNFAAALKFAQQRDHPDLFKFVAVGGDTSRQGCVAGVAAVALKFGFREAFDWAWSIVDRALVTPDEIGPFRYSRVSNDPRVFAMVGLKANIVSAEARADSLARLFGMAVDLNPNIAEAAFAALLDSSAMTLATCWNAAILASDLSSNYFAPSHKADAKIGQQISTHRRQALKRALSRLDRPTLSLPPLSPPPAAWRRLSKSRGRAMRRADNGDSWTYPECDFDPSFARTLIKHFPVERLAEDARLREQLAAYGTELVRWTADRIFPAFNSDIRERASNLYEWMSDLARFVARVIVFVPSDQVLPRFVEPLVKHRRRDVLHYIGDLTDMVTRRHIYDAKEVSPNALEVLDLLLSWMIAEDEFVGEGSHPGRIRDRHLRSMIKSFLLVSATDCSGAERFANGDWSQISALLPQIDRTMSAAGWVDEVMTRFITLAERAGTALPLDLFTRQVVCAMDAPGFRLSRWLDAAIPAEISTAIQKLADANYPLSVGQARGLLLILDRLVDIGDRRAAALQQSEHFRSIQLER